MEFKNYSFFYPEEFHLSSFKIIGLHDDMDVNIELRDNKLVIVAENGIGKTTIVNIIYHTLSRQWSKLYEYSFREIVFELNNEKFTFTKEDLNFYVKFRTIKHRVNSKNHSGRINQLSYYIIENYNVKKLRVNHRAIQNIATEFSVPPSVVVELLEELNFQQNEIQFTDNIEKIINALDKPGTPQILYLPTYRRIEKDLKSILPDLEADLSAMRLKRAYRDFEILHKYVELVEFGMDDVQQKLDRKLDSLYVNFTNKMRSTLMGDYLKDILNKSYKISHNHSLWSVKPEILESILFRIDKSILQDHEKQALVSFVREKKSQILKDTEDQVIAHFIQKVVDVYEKQFIEEKDVNDFVDICNEYCTNKYFFYSRDERKIKIFLRETEKEISLAKLSSGEKQIVSLFSHLYLSNNKKFFVIIDEPELSLSVAWQERLLPDILKAHTIGMIAVTHSPFIFNNRLENHTKGLNEFTKTLK